MPIKIAITGASGYVGTRLIALLQENPDYQIRVLGRKPIDKLAFLSLSETNEQLTTQLQKFDCIIHLAARAHRSSNASDYLRDNLELTERLIGIAKEAQIKQFIFLSSIKAVGNKTVHGKKFSLQTQPQPTDAYGRSKLACEEKLKDSFAKDLPNYTIFRPPLVWGPNPKGNLGLLVRLMNHSIPLPFKNINNHRDLIELDLLCHCIIKSILNRECLNKTLLLSDGVTRSTQEIVRLLEPFARKKVRFFTMPIIIFNILKLIPPLKSKIESFVDDLEIDTSESKRLLNLEEDL